MVNEKKTIITYSTLFGTFLFYDSNNDVSRSDSPYIPPKLISLKILSGYGVCINRDLV